MFTAFCIAVHTLILKLRPALRATVVGGTTGPVNLQVGGERMSVHWYRIEIITGQDTYCYFGSSVVREKELVEALGRGEFVLLGDLTYFDDDGNARRWTEWDPHYQSRIHLNPQHVVSVMPMQDDPKKSSKGGSNLLQYPQAPQPGDE